ncbi:MAG: extracellular solute-binding protein [Lachnospiraceae bacterium]|nr:extracellular solute-binding protein [Lachnospiraceae bacterium]
MKKKIIRIGIPVLLVVAALTAFIMHLIGNRATYVKDVSPEELQAAFDLLNESYLAKGESPETFYVDFLAQHKDEAGKGEYVADVRAGCPADEFYETNSANEYRRQFVKDEKVTSYDHDMQSLENNESAMYKIEGVAKAGLYCIDVDYASIGTSLADYTVLVKINGKQQYQEAGAILLTAKWNDSKDFPQDRYRDEMSPYQNRIKGWITEESLYNNTYTSDTPLCFYLEAGTNAIEIKNISSPGLAVGKINVYPAVDNTKSYEEYHKEHEGATLVSGKDARIDINAIDYVQKNSTQITYGSTKNSSLAPFDINDNKLNVLKWTEAGGSATYEFNVSQDGFYKLALHYQNKKDQFSSFATILIDGKVPFAEMYSYEFKTTDNAWANKVLSSDDKKPYEFYLTEGTHSITVKLEHSKVMEAYRYANLIQKHVTQFQLEITKITGAEVDTDRRWKMTKYIENTEAYLKAYQTIITHIRFLLQDYSDNGNNGAILAFLDKAEVFIKQDLEYPDDIALHVEDLTGADNSILSSVSSFTTELLKDNYSLDRIYVYGDGAKLPKPNQSVFKTALIGTKSLLNTFVSDKYKTSVDEEEETITIWFNKALTHVDILQKMADTEFTPKYGVKVKVTTMPDVGKLTFAVASNETPDIALGLQSYVPFDLASRGAVYDMTGFGDYWETVAEREFPAGSMVSYVYNEGVYALPETTDFSCVVYRTDIFDSLGLQPPDTWDDLVEDVLPTLQRYGKNFYHNISLSGSSYKWFYQTAPMILQNGGELYTKDGTKTAIDEPEAIRGMQVLGDLFTKYSLDTSVASFFNSFRFGEIPIGIAGMEDYTLIKNGAPELEGKWKIAPYIGTNRENGEVDRTFVANGTGAVIFGRNSGKEPTQNQKNAWEFLKWWTSTEVQTEYANALVSANGKTYYWLSANREALRNAAMNEEDKNIILNQIEYVTDIPRTPGQYLLERTVSNIWTKIVEEDEPAQIAVDESVLEVNKEIKRKMREFKFFDANGNKLKDYIIHDKSWIEQKMEEASNNLKGGNN